MIEYPTPSINAHLRAKNVRFLQNFIPIRFETSEHNLHKPRDAIYVA